MVIGITMLKVARGCDTEVYRTLKNMDCIKEIYCILGEFPLFIIMEAENQFYLDDLIDTIQRIPNVIGIWHLLVSNDDNPSITGWDSLKWTDMALG